MVIFDDHNHIDLKYIEIILKCFGSLTTGWQYENLSEIMSFLWDDNTDFRNNSYLGPDVNIFSIF